MKVLCVFGKYQYGDPKRGMGTEYCAFIPALQRLGHEVIHFDSWDNKKMDYAELNRELLNVVERQKPNVVIVVHLLFEIWTETLDILRRRGDVATVSWTTDDSWKYRKCSRFVGPHYHAMTTTYPDFVEKYHSDGIRNVLLTQWAANDYALREPTTAKYCKYQVTFVGAAHGNRVDQVRKLQKAGIPIQCFGFGWPNGSIEAAEIPEIMNASLISINFANSSGENQIKARVFEVAGSGGFLLTQDAAGLEHFYRIGTEIETFQDITEAAEKIRKYLDDPALRDRMAYKSYERTKRDHTYIQRMKDVLEFTVQAKAISLVESGNGEITWAKAFKEHELSWGLAVLRWLLIKSFSLIFKKDKARRAARRLVYEISWRVSGRHTFSAAGFPGRMFPGE